MIAAIRRGLEGKPIDTWLSVIPQAGAKDSNRPQALGLLPLLPLVPLLRLLPLLPLPAAAACPLQLGHCRCPHAACAISLCSCCPHAACAISLCPCWRVDGVASCAVVTRAQLIARIHNPSKEIRDGVSELLVRLGSAHPQGLCFPLTVASHSHEKSASANLVLDAMRRQSDTLVQQAHLVAGELIRSTLHAVAHRKEPSTAGQCLLSL